MRHIIILFALLLLIGCQFSSKKDSRDDAESQTPKTDTVSITEGEFALSDESDSTEIFFTTEDMPEYPGGDAALKDFLVNHTVYPASAIRDRVEGRVYVRIAIEKNGSVSVVDVARGVREDLDNAAMEVVGQMPSWKPGRYKGELRRVVYTIPINYSLDDLEAGKIRAEEIRTAKIYPNPTSGRLSVEVSEWIPDLRYGVYDTNGRLVKQGPVTSQVETIDLSGLSNGTYVVRVSSEEESFMYSERVVKR